MLLLYIWSVLLLLINNTNYYYIFFFIAVYLLFVCSLLVVVLLLYVGTCFLSSPIGTPRQSSNNQHAWKNAVEQAALTGLRSTDGSNWRIEPRYGHRRNNTTAGGVNCGGWIPGWSCREGDNEVFHEKLKRVKRPPIKLNVHIHDRKFVLNVGKGNKTWNG